MDPVREVVEAIHAELNRFSNLEIPCHFGGLERERFKQHPAIVWVEKGGSTQRLPSTVDNKFLVHAVNLRVTIWASSSEACRLLYWNLQQATEAIWGEQAVWGNHSPPTEIQASAATRGSVIETEVTLGLGVNKIPYQVPDFPVPTQPWVEVEVEHTETTFTTVEEL